MTNGAVTEVFAAGSTVYVGGDIEAKVLAVMLDDSAVTYKCVWWSEKERKESWLHACEVTADAETPKKQIGFIPQYVQDVR